MIHDHPRENCGVFGILSPHEDAARLTYFGLLALQHRGQESAGIASADFNRVTSYRGMGLVNQIFSEKRIQKLKGSIAIGHTRYSTAGSSVLKNAQPTVLASRYGDFALAHNGNLANYNTLRKKLLHNGHCLNADVDSELITRIIIESKGRGLKKKIINGISQVEGAYSLVFLTKNKLYIVRDKWGVRPLILGRMNGKGWAVASESAAIETVGGTVEREVEPGEFIEISKQGLETFENFTQEKGGFCIFEYVYFSRPDSTINGKLVYSTRIKAGQLLAQEHPAKADYVVGVPSSGSAAALGYSQESGIPMQEGLTKSRFIGRTFIEPTQKIRNMGVRIKFNPLRSILKNKDIVLVDDSIVRGTTIAQLIKILREAGVRKVHLRISSPPFKNICYLGIDVNRYKELIASDHTLEEIREEVGADSLGYLSITGLKRSVGRIPHGFCTGCFNKRYSVETEELPDD